MNEAAGRLARSGAPPESTEALCGPCPFGRWNLCCGADRGEPRPAISSASRVLIAKGAYVAQEEDRRNGLPTVLSGVLKLSKSLPDGRTQIVGFRFPGDIVTSQPCDSPWRVTVQAVTPVTLCHMSCGSLQRLRANQPELDHMLVRLARDEIVAGQEHMLTLGRKTPVEKLASFLLDIGRRKNGTTGPDSEIEIPMTRSDIGDYLGLENETISRIFTRLKSEGFIDLPQSSTVVLCDKDGIEALSKGELVLNHNGSRSRTARRANAHGSAA